MLVTLNVFVTKCEKTQLIDVEDTYRHYGYTISKTAKLIRSSSLL